MTQQFTGDVEILHSVSGDVTASLHGDHGTLKLGGNKINGDIEVKAADDLRTVFVSGQNGNITLGAKDHDGDLLMNSSDDVRTVHINGEHGNITLGGPGHDGDLLMNASDDVRTVHINGDHGNVTLGGPGHDGDLLMNASDDVRTVHINGDHGNITLGGSGHDGDLIIHNKSDVRTIHLDGDAGDIKLSGSDCAELFGVADECDVEAGTVLVLDGSANLQPCGRAYDKRVAGVVSGAGGYAPGMILDHGRRNGVPVALIGKVWCKVDANQGSVAVGDLLTTSSTPGHAMKARDRDLSFGAVLGKAMGVLESGNGLVPILVTLQ